MMLLVMAMAFVIAPQARSQVVLLTESFENAGAIPANWASVIVTGTTNGLTYITSGSTGYPSVTVTPYNGSYEVFYNAYSIVSGSTRLYRTAGTSTAGYAGASIDFAMYHDMGYTGYVEGITPQYSIDGGTTWTSVGSMILRQDGTSGWTVHNVALPANAGNQANLRIGFLFTSAFGNNIFMDYVHLNGIALGTLAGTVTNSVGGAAIQGATVTVTGATAVTTNAAGFYSVPGLNTGTVSVSITMPGFVPYSGTAAITAGVTTTLNVALVPGPKINGTVTDASTGAPVVGATVTIDLPSPTNPPITMTVGGGLIPLTQLSLSGVHNFYINKTGYDQFVGSITLTAPNTSTITAALLPTAVQPGPFTAALNNPTTPTAVNLNWGIPQGMYQIIYDDGGQENFAIWANANNLNALKFTPLSWPVKLIGGKVNLGISTNYPANVLPFTAFTMLACKADGTGGLPGTIIDSVVVTPTNFGWVDFSFMVPLTINSGDFYLVMKQGGVPPHAAGIGVDLTNTQLRSYSKFVTGSGPWVPAAGNFMMRAIVQGLGGPQLDNSGAAKKLITASAPDGLIYESPVATVTGYEGQADYPEITPTYQVWRLQQGQEGTQASWTSIWTGATNTTVDNGWPSLACGPYRWAVEAIYSPPGQRFSAPTFSNVLGKCWTANVNVCIGLTCVANPKAGTVVKLVNTAYPDTNYTKTSDTSGCVHFTNVWKGSYTMTVTRFTYPVYTQTISVLGDVNLTVTLLQNTDAPTNLVVDNVSLHSTWSPPRTRLYHLNEDFASGSFATNNWTTTTGSNWSVAAGTGNPAPSAMFNWTPQLTNYDQYLTSKTFAGAHAPMVKLKYDYFLSNYGTTNVNTLAVELWNGATWSVLKSYTNQNGNIPWTTETVDISSITDKPAFQIRFHAAGANSVDINNWNIDNVSVYSTDGTSGPNPCVLGYNFYLNNILIAYTPDTMYNIPANQVVYNTVYTACVKAIYGSGYSNPICVTFTSRFLYPARDLTATGIECSTYLTWKKPVTQTDAPQIISITPKQVDAGSPADLSPFAIVTSPSNVDNSTALWDMMFAWPTTTNQETAVVCIGNYIYTCRWAGGPTWFYQYDKTTGVQVSTFDIPGLTACRDFAFDGTNAYATGYTSTINKLDLTAHTIISSLATTGAGNIRHIAYDPVNNGFWVGDWTTMFLVSATTGNVVATGPAMSNAYGSAYDADPTGPFLWVHAQNGANTDELEQFKITGTTLTATGVVKNVGTFVGFPSGGSAGGLETVTNAGKFGLLGAVQNQNWVYAVELRADNGGGGGTGTTPVGLKGYNVYRDGAKIKTIMSPDTLFYYDYNLNPGTYKYDVKALYDLTSYGIATPPAPYGESLMNTAGLQTVTLNCGAPLPFYEPWTSGNFAFNSWTYPAGATNHWSVNTGVGNPAPCADFTWQTVIANYSQALTSEVIDATAWTCAAIWLDFDVKLLDHNATGKEKLTIDVFYNGVWHQKAELTNNGSTNWVAKHIDISSVKGKSFRVRFVANGLNSADILHWYVDNIHAYGICKAPTTLAATQSQFTTTLTWHAPNCAGTAATLMNFVFDDGTAESGVTDNGEIAWLGTEFPISPMYDGVLTQFKMYWMANATGAPFTMQVDVYSAAHVLLGTSNTFTPPADDWITVTAPNIPFSGPFFAMVKWNNNPTATNYFGWDNDGPYTAQDLGWYRDNTGAWAKLSTFGLGIGTGCFIIQAQALVGGQMKEVTLVPGAQSTPGAKTPANNLTKVNRSVDTYYHGVMGPLVASSADSSLLSGYNIYRTDNSGTGPFSKIGTVSATTYLDVHPSTTPLASSWKYFVTAIFKNSVDQTMLCEPSSDTILVHFPATGVSELNSGQIMIYPNPATDQVNIKSDYNISRLDVINFIGQQVYSSSNVESKTIKIDVSAFAVGVYFVKVSTTEGMRTVKITVTH